MYKALDTDAIKSKNKDDFDTFQDTSRKICFTYNILTISTLQHNIYSLFLRSN